MLYPARCLQALAGDHARGLHLWPQGGVLPSPLHGLVEALSLATWLWAHLDILGLHLTASLPYLQAAKVVQAFKGRHGRRRQRGEQVKGHVRNGNDELYTLYVSIQHTHNNIR